MSSHQYLSARPPGGEVAAGNYVILLACALLLLGCDNMHSKHNSSTAAQDTIARGWIPNCLPPGAFAIEETHNLDLNTGEGSFSFTESDLDHLRSKLTPYKPDLPLRIRANRDRHEKRGYQFYSFENFDLAINWQTRHAHFWLAGS